MSGPLALFPCMFYPERQQARTEPQPAVQSLCSAPAASSAAPGEHNHQPALNNVLFFYFYTAGFPVCELNNRLRGFLMDGIA